MDDFRTCSLHDAYHTGCIDCQHDMTEEISILKADNARMREALEELMSECENGDYLCIEYIKQLVEKALKGGE